MFKLPDLRGVIAILTAAAVIVQQAFPGTRWSIVATAVAGALAVHAAAPSPALSSLARLLTPCLSSSVTPARPPAPPAPPAPPPPPAPPAPPLSPWL